VTKPDGSTWHYEYDAFGRRIAKTNGLTRTEFLWQGDRLIAEETGDQYRTYIYEPDTFKPLALLDGYGPEQANIYYYHLDHLGTPQELTNAQGDLVWSVTYRAYGNVVRALVNEIDNPIRFQGQYHDPETGLHYNRHRYYNPNIGRFLTPDPIGLAGGLNNYQYVPNPTGWVDPLGLASTPKSGPDSSRTNPIQTFDPREVAFSQNTVSFNKIDRATGQTYTFDDLVESMKLNGWQGDPVDVVRMPDGGITSMDNTRILAARRAGIDVHARVRSPADELTPGETMRFTRTNSPEPATWGEAIQYRIEGQKGEYFRGSFWQVFPRGSLYDPELSY
ncbi:MAG: RHS repeat-associated core domain-containing protein, partial [Marinobacter sp.]|nr:RHS repeat-associated core domain-containing protein [Marinobacter sp.]